VDAVVAALAIALISSGSAIVVGLVGAWLAKRKGLPGINAEVEQRMQQLVNTLRTEIDEDGRARREGHRARSKSHGARGNREARARRDEARPAQHRG
jgi:hypothetical protein